MAAEWSPGIRMNREAQLQEFIRSQPNEPFPRYGLALEYKNSGRLAEAWTTFQDLIAAFPDYVAAYLHAGSVLVALKRTRDAHAVFQSGIAAASRKNDMHARGELEQALADLQGNDQS
jgi:tetratricopeptide (TPR) repeat protein